MIRKLPLGITTIQRNRAPWIKEWVAFHYLVGFRKFYIYLHKCSDDTEKILTKLEKKFDIKIFIVDPNLEWPMMKCYQDSYANFGDEVDWMAYIDGDEFLFSTSADSMEAALKNYSNKSSTESVLDKKMSALGVYWSCFGSSGHIEEPSGLIIENYKYRASDGYPNNRHIKSIVRGGQYGTVQASGSHLFLTSHGTYDENLRPIASGWTDYEPTYEKFRINHYITQSRSHFLNFKSKFSAPDSGGVRDESFWKEHDINEVFDHSMDKFIAPLKDLLDSI